MSARWLADGAGSALLINVTRGEIVDGEALAEAVRTGQIAGAGLDVWPMEPLPLDHPLWTTRNVLMTPHIAGGSQHRAPRNVARFCTNLHRFREGAELEGVVFTDVEGSTRLWTADRLAMSASLALHDEILRAAIESADGYVFSTAGDSFVAAFRRASDAVTAARRTQDGLAAAAWPGPALRVRMGLHLGEAEERGGDYFGSTVSTAARVAAAGHGGQVLLTEGVRAIADVAAVDLGVHRLRDVAAPLHIFQLGDGRFPALRVWIPGRRTSRSDRHGSSAATRSCSTSES